MLEDEVRGRVRGRWMGRIQRREQDLGQAGITQSTDKVLRIKVSPTGLLMKAEVGLVTV